jgi:predicted esterase YcpF (UPF0227 family)
MAIDHLLYLHGFRSSPHSTKARQMRDHVAAQHPDWTWGCPALPVSPKQAMAMVETLCRAWPKDRTAIVGSSLGGFYATYLGLKWGSRTVLINPAVHPQNHGRVLVGEFPLWHDPSKTIRFEPRFLDELAAIDREVLPPWPDCMTLVGTEDEVLDPQEMAAYYANTDFHWVQGADHAMGEFQAWLPTVDAFLCRP